MTERTYVPGRAPQDLERAGRLLFGRNWKTELAEALKLKDASRLRAMMRGDRPIPDGVWLDLKAMLYDKVSKCASLAVEIDSR